MVQNAKKIALMLMGVAYQRFLMDLEKQQEILAGIADVMMESLPWSPLCCVPASYREKEKEHGRGMCAVFLRDAMARIEMTARTVLAGCSEGDSAAH